MKRIAKLVLAATLAFGVLAPMVASAQTTTKVTEEATIEVLRVLMGGQTVILRNLSTMKVTKYDKIPANATVTIGGKPAKLSDLKQGMRLKGLRIEGVTDTEMSSAEVATMEATPAPAPAPAPAAAPAPAPAPAAAPEPAPAPAEAPKELPHTASSLPLVAFAGVALLLVGGSLSLRRRIQ